MGKKGKGRRQKNKKPNQQNPTQQQTQQQLQAANARTLIQQQPPSSFYSGRGPPVAFTSSLSQTFSFHSLVTDDLVHAIYDRGVPASIDSIEKLQQFLYSTFMGNQTLEPLFAAFAKGLLHGAPIINDHNVSISPESPAKWPLLVWATQYKVLKIRLGCQFSHTLVDLVLRAGADVNQVLPNKVNALFFATKYTSLETVDLLLEHEINVNQRDQFGKTCLHNALEYPDPAIIRRLLEYLSPQESIYSETEDGTVVSRSLVDCLIGFATAPNPPTCWVNMGEPNDEHIVAALLLLRQNNVQVTAVGSSNTLILMGCALIGVTDPRIRYPKLLQKLAKALVGIDIPQEFRPKLEPPQVLDTQERISVQDEEKKDESAEECRICFSSYDEPVKLYCGHTYCRACIVEWGKTESGRGCPLCKSILCLDLDPRKRNRRELNCIDSLLGLERGTSDRQGPRFLSDEQVVQEARAQGIYSHLSSHALMRSKLEDRFKEGMARSQLPVVLPSPKTNGSRRARNCSGRMMLALSNNLTMVLGRQPNMTLLACPTHGPISIEVTVCCLTLLARISNRSLYTMISSSVVKQLGLKRNEKLTSTKFIDAVFGKKCKNQKFTCLEPVTFSIGDGLDVTLHHAIELHNSPFDMFGIQLGQDFLHSGRMCTIDVEVPEGKFTRVYGEATYPISDEPAKESFRYYAHNGKAAELPVIHFNPFVDGTCTSISLKNDVGLNECSWCCRLFPEGMFECAACAKAGGAYFYCDERCQRAAWTIHKTAQHQH